MYEEKRVSLQMTFEARVVLKRAYMNNTFILVKRKDKQKKLVSIRRLVKACTAFTYIVIRTMKKMMGASSILCFESIRIW